MPNNVECFRQIDNEYVLMKNETKNNQTKQMKIINPKCVHTCALNDEFT